MVPTIKTKLLVAAAVGGAALAIALFPRAHNEDALLSDWSQPPPVLVFNCLGWLSQLFHRMGDALVPPPITMFDISLRYQETMLAYVCHKFEISDFLATGPKTVEEIAAHMETEYDVLRVERLMYSLASHGMTQLDSASPDPEKPRFVNTALSATLRSDGPHSMRAMLGLQAEDCFPAWTHFHKLFGPEGKTSTPWDLAWPEYPRSEGGIWGMYSLKPKQEEQFGRAMFALEGIGGIAMVRDGPFGKYDRVLDVAGSLGHQLHKILEEYPTTKGVLFDKLKVIENAKALWRSEYGENADRVEMVGGDFFQSGSLPMAQDGDAYSLRFILHDWGDADCLVILNNLYDAMRGKNATLVVGEVAIPERSEVPTPSIKTKMDMLMQTTLMAKERTPSQWIDLLARAGFDVVNFYPTRPILHWIEAVPRPGFKRDIITPTS